MSRCVAVLLASLFVTSAGPAFAAEPAADPAEPATGADADCQGDLSGAVNAVFNCSIKVVEKTDRAVTFVVTANGPVKGLKAFEPATFTIAMPITVQTYAHRDLVKAQASATTDAGKAYAASQKLGDRGDFEVQVVAMQSRADAKGRARGFVIGMMKAHAHLVPASATDGSEIQMNVQMLTRW